MIITTAKRRRRPRAAPRPLALAVALAALSLAPPSRADWKLTPYIDLQETYTDNVLLQPKEQARSQFITTVAPSVSLLGHTPRIDLTASYSKRFNEYADSSIPGTTGNQQQLQAAGKAKLVEDLLYLDANAGISQQAVSAFGPQPVFTGNNTTNFAQDRSTEVKIFRISPYLVHRFGAAATAQVRYARDRVSSGTTGFGNSNSDTLAVDLASGTAFSRLGWGLNYNRQLIDNTIAPKATSESASGALRYLQSQELTLSLNGGYDKYDYQSLGGRTKGKSWSVAANWAPGARTSVEASVGKRYFGDSYSLALLHRARTSVWSLNYSDAVTTTRQQFVLPQTIDTASLLNQLFIASIPDPAARAQAVAAYIQATGLPPSLANSINYLSNRYTLLKQFQGSAAFSGAHSTLILTLVDAKRTALSLENVDNQLLGSVNHTLNDNTHQSSAGATLNWRLSSRTSVDASAVYSRIRSLALVGLADSNRTDTNRTARVNLRRQFGNTLTGGLELRHVKGTATDGARNYTENAIAATLSKHF
jgi:uncharacterized protein (PEP-CTERM system associated)